MDNSKLWESNTGDILAFMTKNSPNICFQQDGDLIVIGKHELNSFILFLQDLQNEGYDGD